jgi:hypothetical protein
VSFPSRMLGVAVLTHCGRWLIATSDNGTTPHLRWLLRAVVAGWGGRYGRLLSLIARNSLSARQFGQRDEFALPSPTS